MNANQRQKHTIIWILLSIGLPILMYFSISMRSDFKPESNSLKNYEQLRATADKTYENELLLVFVKGEQMHLQLKQPLKSASTVLYAIDSNGNSTRVLGQLNIQSDYMFELPNNIAGIQLFDTLKNMEISKVLF